MLLSHSVCSSGNCIYLKPPISVSLSLSLSLSLSMATCTATLLHPSLSLLRTVPASDYIPHLPSGIARPKLPWRLTTCCLSADSLNISPTSGHTSHSQHIARTKCFKTRIAPLQKIPVIQLWDLPISLSTYTYAQHVLHTRGV